MAWKQLLNKRAVSSCHSTVPASVRYNDYLSLGVAEIRGLWENVIKWEMSWFCLEFMWLKESISMRHCSVLLALPLNTFLILIIIAYSPRFVPCSQPEMSSNQSAVTIHRSRFMIITHSAHCPRGKLPSNCAAIHHAQWPLAQDGEAEAKGWMTAPEGMASNRQQLDLAGTKARSLLQAHLNLFICWASCLVGIQSLGFSFMKVLRFLNYRSLDSSEWPFPLRSCYPSRDFCTLGIFQLLHSRVEDTFGVEDMGQGLLMKWGRDWDEQQQTPLFLLSWESGMDLYFRSQEAVEASHMSFFWKPHSSSFGSV